MRELNKKSLVNFLLNKKWLLGFLIFIDMQLWKCTIPGNIRRPEWLIKHNYLASNLNPGKNSRGSAHRKFVLIIR